MYQDMEQRARRVAAMVEKYGCDEETAQRYVDYLEEGYPSYQAGVLSGLRDPDY